MTLPNKPNKLNLPDGGTIFRTLLSISFVTMSGVPGYRLHGLALLLVTLGLLSIPENKDI